MCICGGTAYGVFRRAGAERFPGYGGHDPLWSYALTPALGTFNVRSLKITCPASMDRADPVNAKFHNGPTSCARGCSTGAISAKSVRIRLDVSLESRFRGREGIVPRENVQGGNLGSHRP